MSKKNKFEGIINDVGSFASNNNNNVDNSVVNTSNADDTSNVDGITDVIKKPVFNNITDDNVLNNNKADRKAANISNIGSKASNTNKAKMSIIVVRRKKK